MSPKQRKAGPYADRPENTTVRIKNGTAHFGWIDPRTKQESSLKAPGNKQLAYDRAKKLNAIAASDIADKIINRIATAKTGTTLSQFIPAYLEIFEKERSPATNTMRSRKCTCRAWTDAIGNTPMIKIQVQDARQVLRNYEEQGKTRMAQSLRSTLIDIYQVAHQEGIIPASHPNIGEILRMPKSAVKRARLTLEEWEKIHTSAASLGPWVQNAMLLAITTGQRLIDLSIARFKRQRDWENRWHNWQQARAIAKALPADQHPYPFIEDDTLHIITTKTGALIRIPLDLRLDAINQTVGAAISACRNNTASRYLIHHTKRRTMCNPGDRVHENTISKGFKRARDLTGLTWPGQTPPTFHEMRSLAKRLYAEQGIDTKALLGHKTQQMSDLYADPRGAEWTEVTNGKNDIVGNKK